MYNESSTFCLRLRSPGRRANASALDVRFEIESSQNFPAHTQKLNA